MHRIFATTTSLALLFATGAMAQDQQTQPEDGQQQAQQAEAGQQGEGPFVQAQESDLFVTNMMGIPVYAAEEGGNVAAGGQAIDSAQLAEFEQVGLIADIMMTLDGEPRAFVVALGTFDPDDPAAAPADAGVAAGPGVGREVGIEAGQIGFFTDETAPHLIFAVTAVSIGELDEAPLLERPQMAMGGTGPVAQPAAEPGAQAGAHGWMMGRDPMMAPNVAMDGWQQVPVAEISADDLTGAAVYGAEQEQIGSINDVHLGADGAAEYVTVDIGGFLGLGTHTVAVGFDELTVMRDAGWDDLQVHVAATRDDLEAMPEYEQN